MKIRLLFLICCSFVFLSGCWDSRELQDIDLIAGVGVDINADGSQSLTLEIVTSSNASDASESESEIFTSSGLSIADCVDEMSEYGAKRLFWTHNQIILFGESLANYDISSYLDYFMRESTIRPTTNLAVFMGNTSDFFAMSLPQGFSTPSTLLSDAFKKQKNDDSGAFLVITLQEFVDDIVTEGIEPILPVVTMQVSDEENPVVQDIISVENFMIFSNGKMTGITTEIESRGIIWVRNSGENGIVVIENIDGSTTTVEILSSSVEIETGNNAGFPVINLLIEATCAILEDNGGGEEYLYQKRDEITSAINEKITEEIEAAWQKAVASEADFLGFGKEIYRYETELWDIYGANWNENLGEVVLDITVNSELDYSGDTTKSIEWK